MNKFRIYKEMIDIDYYVYFSKAYFAYNAYLKAKYPNENDRGKIKKIKENHILKNKFKKYSPVLTFFTYRPGDF